MIFLLQSCLAAIILGCFGIRFWHAWYLPWKREAAKVLDLADAFDPDWVWRQQAERLKYTTIPNGLRTTSCFWEDNSHA